MSMYRALGFTHTSPSQLHLRPLVAAVRSLRGPCCWILAAGVTAFAPLHATDSPMPPAAETPVQTRQLQEVEVNASTTGSAITQAPAQSDLDITQPQSVIDLDYISNHTSPTADYATIAALAPGVANISPAGPGLGEAKQTTLRGFSDSEYNVTYDGIPFGDTNDFSHHTSSYFPAKVIGQVDVERGPGSASQIGEATFGGTIALRSKDPRDHFSFIPTYSVGSYGTSLTHLELNSGKFENGGKLIVAGQYNTTDTAQTHSPMSRKTGYIKYVQPVGERTELTFVSNYNYINFRKPDKGKLTQQEIDTLGRHFGLNTDPASTDYEGYNFQKKETDLEYLGLSSQLSEQWTLDNKLYTYAYENLSNEKAFSGTKSSPDAMGGYLKINNYRAYGDTLGLAHTDDHGVLRFGGWFEVNNNQRSSRRIDYSRGQQLDIKPGADPLTAYKYTMRNKLRTAQVYVEYAWQPTDQLTVTPGLKYINVRRSIDTPRNQTTLLPLNYTQTNGKALGYLTANYLLRDDWSIYGQVAQGFLAPNLNQFYVIDPALNKTKPQKTLNYQFGTVYKTDRFNADADVYYIDYQNYPLTSVDPVTNEDIYALAKGARLKGVEAEGTYYLGAGLSLYANGSVSQASFKRSGLDIPNVPNGTAALGAFYNHAGFFASLSEKYVGMQRVYNGDFNPDVASSVTATSSSAGFWQTGMSIGYGQNLVGSVLKSYKFRLKVDNLLASDDQIADSVKKGNTYYLVLPGRSWFASLSLAF